MKRLPGKRLLLIAIMIFHCMLFISTFLYAQTQQAILESRVPIGTIPESGLDFTKVKDFTGNVSLPIPLLNIGGISVQLKYYGQGICNQVRTENQYAPSGVVGLGWQLLYGSISAEINNNTDTSDDKYYYNSPDGSFQLQEDSLGIFRIPNYKPWRIQRIVNSGIITGWIITKEDGTIFRFGNYYRSNGSYNFQSTEDSTYATRFFLGINRLVLDPDPTLYSGLSLIPYQWDLSDVQDVGGNHTNVIYQQALLPLITGGTSSASNGKWYTSESHPSKILDNKGNEADFNYSPMSSGEYYSYGQTYGQNLEDTLYLNSINILGNGQLYKKITCSYQTGDILNLTISKRFLTGFVIQDKYGNSLPSYSFGYYGLNGISAEINPGAIKNVIDPKGGQITYKYTTQTLGNVSLSKADSVNNIDYWNYLVITDGISFVHNDDGSSGKDFTVVRSTNGNVKVYRLGASGWYQDNTFPILNTSKTYVSGDYVVCYGSGGGYVVKRTQEGWKTYDVAAAILNAEGIRSNDFAVIGGMSNYFVVKHNNQSSGLAWNVSIVWFTPSGLRVYKLPGSAYWDQQTNSKGQQGSRENMVAFCGENYMVLVSDSANTIDEVFTHVQFSPSTGSWTTLMDQNHSLQYGGDITAQEVLIGKNFIVCADPSMLKTYKRTGNGISLIENLNWYKNETRSFAIGDNFYACDTMYSNGHDYIVLKTWNGTSFTSQKYIIGGAGSMTTVGNKLILAGSDYTANYRKLGYITYLPATNSWSSFTVLDSAALPAADDDMHSFGAGVNQSTFAELWYDIKATQRPYIRAYKIYGDSVLKSTVDNLNLRYYTSIPEDPSYWIMQPGQNFVSLSRPGVNYNFGPDSIKMYTFNNCSDGTIQTSGAPTVPVLYQRIEKGGMGDSSLYTYSYNNGVFNEYLTSEYRNVTETQPGNNGRIVSSYYTHIDSVVSGLNYRDLDGMIYKTDEYNSAGTVIRETNNKWAAIGVDSINGVFNTELLKDSTITDGVNSLTSYTYEPAPNFQTSVVAQTNSDGTIKRTYMRYPQDYSNTSGSSDSLVMAIDSMQTSRHMINKVIEKYVTQQSSGSEQVISGEITGYKNFSGLHILPWEQWKFNNSAPLALSSYVLSVNGSTFSKDSHYSPLNQSFDAYDNYGNLLQSTDANGIITSIKYGYNYNCPTLYARNIAGRMDTSIVDFEDITTGDWSQPNGGSFSNTAHTGQEGYYMPGTGYMGMSKTFQVSQLNTNGKYVFSGWVKASGDGPGLWICIYYNGTYQFDNANTNATTYGQWQYLEDVVDLSAYPNVTSIVLYVLNGHYTYHWGGLVYNACYWDDIHFYPAGAEIVTADYNPVTLQITSKTDANSNTTFYGYDGYGRLNKTFASIGGKKKIIREDRTQYSRKYSNNFDPAAPNLKETILYSNPAGYSDYSSSDDWGWGSVVGTFNYLFDNKITVKMAYENSDWVQLQKQTDSLHGIARVDFYPTDTTGGRPYVLVFGSADGYRFNVMYIPELHKFSMQLYNNWQVSSPLKFSLDAPVNHWYTVEIEKFTDGKACAYVYPYGEGRIYKPGYYYTDSTYLFPKNWNPYIYSYASFTTYYLADFYYGNPERQEVFTDGLGRKLQQQLQHNDSTIVSSTFTYDQAGRQNKIYKPYEIKPYLLNMGLYDPSYVENSNYYYNSGMGAYRFDSSYQFTNLYGENIYNQDPLGRVSETGYPGSPWSINSGNDTRFRYESTNGNLYKNVVTDENGIEADTYKDTFGRVVQTVNNPGGLGLTTNYTYDADDNLLSTTDPTGKQTSYAYNTLNKLTQKTSPDAGTTQYIYDNNGNLRFVKDANHQSDSVNNININGNCNSGSPLSGSFTLVNAGNVIVSLNIYHATIPSGTMTAVITDGNNVVTLYSLSATTSNPYPIGSIYLPKGTYYYSITSIISPMLNCAVTCQANYDFVYYKYDALNRATEEGEYQTTSLSDFSQANANSAGFPATGSNTLVWKQYFYDTPSSAEMASGQRNLEGKLSYAQAFRFGNLSSIYYYSYDDMGRPEWVVLANIGSYQKKLSYSYDMQGNVLTKDFYDYDPANLDFNTTYAYDNLNRLNTVKTQYAGGTTVQEGLYKYYANGKVKRLQLGNAQGVDYTYNERDWLQMINQQNLNGWQDPGHDSSVIPFDRFGEVIGYNVIGHIGSAQGAGIKYNGNISWLMYQMSGVPFSGSQLVGNTYAYDNTNRLTASNFGYYYGSGWQTTAAFDAGYSYDNAGNFTTLQRYGSTGSIQDNLSYTYTAGTNKLSSISGSSSATYNYDSNGNVRYDTHRGIGYIIYDPNNLPVYAYLTNGQQLIYENDVNGSRVRNTISGTSDNFYFNGVDGKTEAVSAVTSGSNMTYNILGLGGDNIGQVKVVSASPARYYYLKDHLGSIKMTVDTTGTVAGYDDYYPYGMQMSGRSLVASEDGRYKFTGKELDSDEGLYYFGARYYDTWNARWLQVDPMAAKYPEWSPYNYSLVNPLIYIDANGDSVNWSQVGKGFLTTTGGLLEGIGGFTLAATTSETGIGAVEGVIFGMHGLATAGFGFSQIIEGFADNNTSIPSGPLEATGQGVAQVTGQDSFQKWGEVGDNAVGFISTDWTKDYKAIKNVVFGIESIKKGDFTLKMLDFANGINSGLQTRQSIKELLKDSQKMINMTKQSFIF